MKFQSISFILFFLVVLLRFYFVLPVYKNGDFIRITSRVYNEPVVYDRQQFFVLEGLKIYLPKYPEINYGDDIVVEGIVDDKKLLNSRLVEIKEDNGNFFYNLRQKLILFYKSSLPEPYGSLMAGVVLGSKNMPPEFWEKLKQTGTAHIVVASGTNVTMFASFLISSLTYYISRKKAVFIAAAGIVFYVLLSGFDAPIVRAGMMGVILLFGQMTGRVTDTWNILTYTFISMLLLKPLWLMDIGFILSFVATASLLLFQKTIDFKLKKIPNILREGLSTSLAAQIGVAPIIFVTFGQFNLLSPFINALILWTVPYVMAGGAVAGVVGLFIPLIGRLILFILFPLVWYFIKILSIF